jgi:diguanylate cyclase (GGDEF)-like protein/PAS domain S-box-containing protein
MKNKREQPVGATELRRRAEKKLRERKQTDASPPATEAAKQRLVHELEVHQIELEMQNEELRRAQEELEESRAKYFDLYDIAPVGYLTLSAQGIILDANLTAASLLGVETSRLVKKAVTRFIAREDQDVYYLHRQKLLDTRAPQVCELKMMKKGAAAFWVQLHAILAGGAGSDTPLFRVGMSDITERKRAEHAAKEAREFAENIVSTIREPLLVLSADLKVISANRSFYEAFKSTPEATEGQSIYQLGDKQWDIPELRKVLGEILEKHAAFDDFEVEREFPAIGRRTVLLSARTVYREPDKTEAILLGVEDITDRKQMQQELQESIELFEFKSFHDGLTGLYNRNYFSEQMAHLGQDLGRAAPVSIISIDIDGLKIINDTLGHNVGDDLLISAARLISACFRKVDVIARIGGDEFCVILTGVDHKGALAKKTRIAKQVAAYNRGAPSVPMNMSVGVATSQGVEGETIYDIYQRADENMYQYKLIQAKSQKSKVIDMLLAALSERDFVAQGHADRLSTMAERIARRLGLPDDTRKNLILLAKVHDIGKVGIPDKILFKARRLSEEERRKMKEHAQIGYALASRSRELFHIADLVLHHHEFWDGKGYTAGLEGEQIPLECRIFSIMDAYDAMTNTRPYRKAMGKKPAIRELKKCSGTQFEPRLVDEFIGFVEDK